MSIIVRLKGGLGNQLFQYAFARAIAARLKTTYSLDWAPFNQYFHVHKYSLHHFNTTVPLAKGRDMLGFVWFGRHYNVFGHFYRILRLKKTLMPFYFPEKTFAFDREAYEKKGTTYFDGFWQTEKYFKDIEAEIRKELTLKEPMSEYSANIGKSIREAGTNAVSLHVRRADLVTNPTMTAFHGYCSPEYYAEAIKYIAERLPSPHFFIFSDDYDWSVEHFKDLPYPHTVINNSADKNYEDLTLMSMCRQHIIANSSFGWWGAWLDPGKDKIVIAPKRWFAHGQSDTKDLLPDGWITM